MPYTIKFENEGTGVVVSWTGSVHGEELLAANLEMYRQDKDNKICYQLWDFSNTDYIDITDEHIRESAMQDSVAAESNPDQRVAIIGSDLILAGSSRIYKIYAEVWCGFESETFSSISEARAWVEKSGYRLE